MKKSKYIVVCFLIIFFFITNSSFAEEIQTSIKGIAQSTPDMQRDYKEAVIDAKIKAIEQAGGEIKSLSQIKNFQLKAATVETRSKGLLLPGYQIIDMGYGSNGTYQVILTGRLKKA